MDGAQDKKVSFSNCSTLESVFKKFRFRVSFYADTSVLVWTEGVSVTIKLPFQIYPALCGPGPSRLEREIFGGKLNHVTTRNKPMDLCSDPDGLCGEL